MVAANTLARTSSFPSAVRTYKHRSGSPAEPVHTTGFRYNSDGPEGHSNRYPCAPPSWPGRPAGRGPRIFSTVPFREPVAEEAADGPMRYGDNRGLRAD